MAEAHGFGPAEQVGPAVTGGVDAEAVEQGVLDAGVADVEADDLDAGEPPVVVGLPEQGVVG
jgi:hypothetical protein